MSCVTLNELPPPPLGKTGWPWTGNTQPMPEKMPDGSEWPKISIVTPNYNYDRFLEETIRSVLLQGYPNLEYIIIDGGSTDNSIEIIKKYEPWLTYWVSEPDQGQSNAINKGFKQATGLIFNWLNSDDALMPNALIHLGQIFSLNPDIDWISGGRMIKDEDGTFKEVHLTWQISWPLYSIGLPDFPQEATFFSANIWEKIGGLDETLECGLDVLFFYQVLVLSKIGVFTQAPFSILNIHPEQKTYRLRNIGNQESHEKLVPIIISTYESKFWDRLLRTRFSDIIFQILKLFVVTKAKSKFKVARYNYWNENTNCNNWFLSDFSGV
ncbi:family 2 glycosyl transferase [Nostoc sp. NIES-4103]|nr:family 2 glycosyl transferase [Nostoc sp. NIES-4103]